LKLLPFKVNLLASEPDKIAKSTESRPLGTISAVRSRLGLKNRQVGEKWVSDDCSYLCEGLYIKIYHLLNFGGHFNKQK
jgi:hypothetical protein